jgi:acyl carrier protein
MIPTVIVPLCSLPLNSNGKVDRAALPKLNFGDQSEAVVLKPGATIEETILAVWKAVLKTDRIERTSNFFDLGGDSLSLVSAHAQLERLLGREFPVIEMFEHTTVQALARHLSEHSETSTEENSARASRQRNAFAARRARRTRSI